MKEYKCVQINHHKDVGPCIQEYERKGRRLHTYQATGIGMDVKHYLLFESA